MLALADGLGLDLWTGGKLHGAIVPIERARSLLGQVAYRQGDWFFRAAEKQLVDDSQLNEVTAKAFAPSRTRSR